MAAKQNLNEFMKEMAEEMRMELGLDGVIIFFGKEAEPEHFPIGVQASFLCSGAANKMRAAIKQLYEEGDIP